jgi:hypothetical protein
MSDEKINPASDTQVADVSASVPVPQSAASDAPASGAPATEIVPTLPPTPEDEKPMLGIVPELGAYGPGAIITESGLAKLLKRHPVSIKRAVQRGELPPPVRLCGGPAWTVGTLVSFMEKRLEAAAKEAERQAHKVESLRP